MANKNNNNPEPTPGHGLGKGIFGALASVDFYARNENTAANREYVDWFIAQEPPSIHDLLDIAQRIEETLSTGPFLRPGETEGTVPLHGEEQLKKWLAAIDARVLKWATESAKIAKKIEKAKTFDALQKIDKEAADSGFDFIYVGGEPNDDFSRQQLQNEQRAARSTVVQQRALQLVENEKSVARLEQWQAMVSNSNNTQHLWYPAVSNAIAARLDKLKSNKNNNNKNNNAENTGVNKNNKNEDDDEEETGMPVWQIVLIALAGIVAIFLIFALIRWLVARSKRKSESAQYAQFLQQDQPV